MRIFIVGGTGFLGYHASLEFLKRGHEVSTISIPDVELGSWFPKQVTVTYGNVFEMENAELRDIFRGYDAMVYAVGPDDRIKPKEDAYNFFHERLVEACGRVVAAAREAGVKKTVVLNSYFAYFDRIWPKRKLAEHHPYIKCRIEQADRVIHEGQDKMDVVVLELPYIFGSMPGRIPLWKEALLDDLIEMGTIYYPKGGTNMISVQGVAESIVGAVEYGKHGKRYPVGDVNMTWDEMLTLMFQALGEQKPIKHLPRFIMNLVGRQMHRKELKGGRYSGLDLRHLFNDIQTRYFYFDPTETAAELRYNRGDVKEHILETVKKCYPDRWEENHTLNLPVKI